MEHLKMKGQIFEREILIELCRRFPGVIVQVAEPWEARSTHKFKETIRQMRKGALIIVQGILHNYSDETFGAPDILCRSDFLNILFQAETISNEESKIGSPTFETPWHYVVIDIKWSTLHLNVDGRTVRNTASTRPFKAQITVYNNALGEMQGYLPPCAYILGKGWVMSYTRDKQKYTERSRDPFNRPGIIDYSGRDSVWLDKTKEIIENYKLIENEGANWRILPKPSNRLLYPNMNNSHDGEYHSLKDKVSLLIGEMTYCYKVTVQNRNTALDNRITSLYDVECNAGTLGIKGPKVRKIVNAIIVTNRDSSEQNIFPLYIQENDHGWQDKEKLAFYLDLETVESVYLGDGNETIFMIGFVWTNPVTGEVNREQFTARTLDNQGEFSIMDQAVKRIREIKIIFDEPNANIYHWGCFEQTHFRRISRKYNYPVDDLHLIDFYQIMVNNLITVKGAWRYGLKVIAKAMHQHGYIQTIWDDDNPCADGMNAMSIAYYSYQDPDFNLNESNDMKAIAEYNMIDCMATYEIIEYLRQNHC